jgi:lipoate-protein ligase A
LYIDERILNKLDNYHSYSFCVYEPDRIEVILGRACNAEEDVHLTRCREDGIPIHRRAGGGGTVLLCRGVAVVSVAGSTDTPFALKEHMAAVNMTIISALEVLGVKGLSIKGISDITVGNRKILGASLHRRRDVVLYQGSLLVDPEMGLFDRYLKHPKKEPDYRAGRKHREFLTSLVGHGYRIPSESVIKGIMGKLDEGPPWKRL